MKDRGRGLGVWWQGKKIVLIKPFKGLEPLKGWAREEILRRAQNDMTLGAHMGTPLQLYSGGGTPPLRKPIPYFLIPNKSLSVLCELSVYHSGTS